MKKLKGIIALALGLCLMVIRLVRRTLMCGERSNPRVVGTFHNMPKMYTTFSRIYDLICFSKTYAEGRMRFALVGILLMAGWVSIAQAQSAALPRAAPETVGMSSERLARFDAMAADYVRKGRVAGVVALVLRGGHVVYESVHGTLDIATNLPMRSDAIFRIASQSKLVTSVAIMILVEKGQLLLADPVARYIPAFESTTVALVEDGSPRIVPAERPITIKDLLTHTAGIPGVDEIPQTLQARYAESSLDQSPLNYLDEPIGVLVERLGGLPFVAHPGTRFDYGFSTDVLGAVIEQASGMKLDEFFRRRIFDPLDMYDTHFFLPVEKIARLAANHNPREGGGLTRASDDDNGWTGQGAFVRGPRRAFSGGGGLLSTVHDYARLLQMLLNGGELGGTRILSPATVRLMTVNHVGDLYAKSLDYPGMGFGFNVEVKMDAAVGGYDVPVFASPGAFGWGGAAYTTFWVDPDEELIGLFMAQLRPHTDDLSKKFGSIVYGAIVEPAR
jgi:CubicO group peptidase (beta-lactamase class C family)